LRKPTVSGSAKPEVSEESGTMYPPGDDEVFLRRRAIPTVCHAADSAA